MRAVLAQLLRVLLSFQSCSLLPNRRSTHKSSKNSLRPGCSNPSLTDIRYKNAPFSHLISTCCSFEMSAVSKVCLSATDWGLIKFASKVFMVQVPLRSTFNLILPDTFLRAYNQRPFARGVGQKKKRANLSADFFCIKESGERCTATAWRAQQPQASLRARRGWRPLRRLGGFAPCASTPPPGIGRPRCHSAPTRQASRSLPPSSRPLLRALGKKSGQRGAGTKDPAAHGDQGRGAIPLQAPGTDAAWGRLPVHTRRVLPGRSHKGVQTRANPHTRRGFLTAGTEIPASSFRQVGPVSRCSDPGPRARTSRLPRPASSAPALSEAVGTRPRPPTRTSHHGSSSRSAGPARRRLLAPRAPRRLGGGVPSRGAGTRVCASHPLRGRPRHPSLRIPAAPSFSSAVSGTRAYYLVHL